MTGNADEAMFEDLDELSEDWPYCECDNEPTEDEEATNQCASCGKALS